MMKLTFQGDTIDEIFASMADMLATKTDRDARKTAPVAEPQGLTSEAAIARVEKPVDKPVDKMAKARAARGKPKAAPAPAPAPEPEEAPEPFGEVDPAEMVKVRQKTLEDLQTAYANGHHKEVLELLSRFGNGAKSFRELPPEAFTPIREAIDNGALT